MTINIEHSPTGFQKKRVSRKLAEERVANLHSSPRTRETALPTPRYKIHLPVRRFQKHMSHSHDKKSGQKSHESIE